SSPILQNLKKRGLIEQITDEVSLNDKLLKKEKLSLYCGADPTAPSLHIGNLLPLMVLLHFNLRGHDIVGLVGGATGAVGDPSGRSSARTAMRDDVRNDNTEKIKMQLSNFLKTGVKIAKSRNPGFPRKGDTQIVNNHLWWKDVNMLQFLADYGPHIRVGTMLARDSVKSRLDTTSGLGFNEFTYQILQAFDFHYLNKTLGVNIEVGGNDQYGNIIAGIDLITRIGKQDLNHQKFKNHVYGLTVPLLTTSDGQKFGKSAGNAIFIDKDLTSSYELFQFLINVEDDDVGKFLYKFSFLPIDLINNLLERHFENKRLRIAQKFLAIELCDLIHGDGCGLNNLIISDFLFSDNDNNKFPTSEVIKAFKEQKLLLQMTSDELDQIEIYKLLTNIKSKNQSNNNLYTNKDLKRLISGGGVYIGFKREQFKSLDDKIDLKKHLLDDKLLIIRLGKKDYHLIEL
ncbi:hypothetical protein PACTADRAFT_30724, partial [Pachysolen tannophilus NRRL Y-2460]